MNKNHHFYSILITFVLTALGLALNAAPVSADCGGTTLCVDANAPGSTHDGLSWTTAYTNVQDALDVTNTDGTTDYTIWVAKGVYYPDQDSDGDHVPGAVTETFALHYDNVQLYGGFPTGGGAWADRDGEAYPTILSGDIDANDWNTDTNHIAEVYSDMVGDNAYHVLWLDGVTYEDITTATVLDGLIVTAGQANSYNSPDNLGGGLYCDGSGSGHVCSPALANVTFSGNQAIGGGGMFNDATAGGTSSPILTGVTFAGNRAGDGGLGGGMFNDAANGGASSPVLTNVTFAGNQAGEHGGGIANMSRGGTSSPMLTNVTFAGNQAIYGGGMANYVDGGGTGSPALANVTFAGNWAPGGGGGGMYHFVNGGTGSPVLTNVTFAGNYAYIGGGMCNFGTAGSTSSPTLVNAILWGNSANNSMQIYNSLVTPTLSYSLVEGSGGSSSWDSSLGTDGGGNIDTDPRFVHPITATLAPTTTGDYRLLSTSPAIDAGNNLSVTVSTDLDGNPRLVDGNGDGTATVDMGAYERQVLYVDTDAPGGDGTSWANAFRYLQDALDVTNTDGTTDYTILVAKGVYYPDQDSDGDHVPGAVTETFALHYDNVQLYGGFPAGGGAWADRDWEAYPTILSGDIDANDWNTDTNHIAEVYSDMVGDNAYHVLYLDGVTYEDITIATVIDGFIITAGQANDPTELYTNAIGGGLYCNGSSSGHACSPALIHVIFSGNQAIYGGGMFNDGGFNDGSSGGISSPALTHVTFSGNLGFVDGGGMCNWSRNGGASSPVLIHVTFSGNWGGEWGGGMSNYAIDSGTSSPALTHVTFSGNWATLHGGGMSNSISNGVSNPALTNVTFSGNQAGKLGGGMYNEVDGGVSNPALTNVTFSGNQADYYGGGMYNDVDGGVSSPALTNVILWGNSATSGTQIYNGDATLSVSYSLVQGGIGGSGVYNEGSGSVTDGGGNLDADPRFVHPITATLAPTTTGNYRLLGSSPAIDAGDNSAVTVLTDRDGNPRIVNGTVDMGAYEQSPLLTVSKSVTPTETIPYHGNVTYTVILSNSGVLSDTNVLFTDTLTTLPIDFARWVISPTNTTWSNGEITWRGPVTAGHALTWTWTVTHTGTYVEVVTNTAEFSGSLQTGSATASFQVNAYVITPTAGAGGSITPDTTQVVNHGDDITFIIAPDTGYHINDVWIDDSSVGAMSVVTFTTVTASHTLSAAFALDEHTLTVDVIGQGSVTRVPSQTTYLYGDVITLTATADPGWTFANWSDGLGSVATLTTTIAGDTVITATFIQDAYTLDVHVDPAEGGSVTRVPSQTTYLYGDVVTLTAETNLGWTFANWNGGLGSAAALTTTITGDTVITATFTQDAYTLTVDIVGDGSVTVDPDQTTYRYGDTVTLTATAAPGWTFANWSDGLGSVAMITTTIAGDTIITATFTQDAYTLDVHVDPAEGGSVTRVPSQTTYLYGDVVTLTATADPGWTFAGWSDGLGSAAAITAAITGDTVITATFALSSTANTAPTISAIDDQTTSIGMPVGPLAFTIGDAETPATELTLTGTSSNPLLVPTAHIAFSGSGADRAVTITPTARLSGTATITVTINDGKLDASRGFALTVIPHQIYLPLVHRK